jgi:glycosyltransferase involved in cell wall biosynthesis
LLALPFVGGFDVIWAANPNLFCFYSALVYGSIRRKPIVRNLDDLWPEVFYELGLVKSGLMRKLLNFLAWLSYAVPAAITPISPGYKRWIVSNYGISERKVNVIEAGVDGANVPDSDKNSTDGRFVVMYSGSLSYGYDFDVILDAASLLVKNREIVFHIRGVGELSSELKKRIRRSHLPNVILDDKFLSKDKLAALLSSADAFVLPMADIKSIDMGLPTKIFEYQANGKPIICISCGEPARYVEATRSGLIVKPKDAKGFADAVIRLYKDHRLASKLGSNGRHCVSRNLTVEKIGERMFKTLLSVTR